MRRFATTSAMSLAMLVSSVTPMAVMAQDDSQTENETAGDPACMKTAIDKRETAIIGSFDGFSTSIKTAHEARKAALMSAWDKTNVKERREALREARKTFKRSTKDARNTMREARKDAWDTFKTDAEACGYHTSKEDGSAREDQGLTA